METMMILITTPDEPAECVKLDGAPGYWFDPGNDQVWKGPKTGDRLRREEPGKWMIGSPGNETQVSELDALKWLGSNGFIEPIGPGPQTKVAA